MNPLHVVGLLALLFAGTHIGLATAPLRSRLTDALGEWGFRWLFIAVASVCFTVLIVYYSDHRDEGGLGLALGASPAWRPFLIGLLVTGVTLMVAGFWTYPGGAYSVDRPRPPQGLERITRHPFFAGLVLFGSAHALLAPHRMGMILMLALAAVSVVGARHQDAKLLRLRGKPFADYLAATSAIPFAAIASGRNRLVWRELPLGGIATGLVIAAGLRYVHDDIFAHHGLWVIVVVVGSALVLAVTTWLRDRRRTVAVSHHRAA